MATSTDQALLVDGSPDPATTTFKWRSAKRVIAGLGVVGVTLSVIIPASGMRVSHPLRRGAPQGLISVDERAGVFKQCGGKNFGGPTFCEPGCLCQPDGDYFSMCKPPEGADHCDAELAIKAAKDAFAVAQPLVADAQAKKTEWEEAQKTAATAKHEAEKAGKLADEAFARQKDADKAFDKAKREKDVADDAAFSHGTRYEAAKEDYQKAAKAYVRTKKAYKFVAREAASAEEKAASLGLPADGGGVSADDELEFEADEDE